MQMQDYKLHLSQNIWEKTQVIWHLTSQKAYYWNVEACELNQKSHSPVGTHKIIQRVLKGTKVAGRLLLSVSLTLRQSGDCRFMILPSKTSLAFAPGRAVHMILINETRRLEIVTISETQNHQFNYYHKHATVST